MVRLRQTPVEHPEQMKSYWKREWKSIALTAFFGTVFNAGMSLGPVYQGKLVDTITADSTLDEIVRAALLFVGIILVIQIMRFIKRYYVRLFANRTSASMRKMLYNNIMNKSQRELMEEHAGDLMTKAVADVDICVEGMRKVTTEVFDTGVLMVGYFCFMLSYDCKITILACIFVPVAMMIAEKMKKFIVKTSKAARAQSSRVAEETYENIEHTVLYRIHGIEEQKREAYFTELADLEKKSILAGILENSMQPVYNIIALLGIVFVFYIGGSHVIRGVWTVGMLLAYITMFTALTTKASKAAKLFNAYQKASVSWKRIKPYLKDYVEEDKNERYVNQKKETLLINNLTFQYPDGKQPLIRGLDLTAHTGDIIGITGPVACGKSALLAVLQGFYPYEGSIRLFGTELSEYSQAERSRRIAALGHMPQLLSDTIEQNITLGDEGDVEAVLKDVCFETDLKSMPDGIATMVGNSGVRLSGGQQARIALARTLYRKSPLLILDDPFSAVDQKTEREIMEHLRQHYKDRIILLISHRLAVFPELDSIVLLHADHTAEYGTHEKMMQESQLYQELYRLQTGGADHEE